MTIYLDSAKPFPHCPGCGHPHVLRSLDQALEKGGLDRKQIVLVTDIGCVGLADAMFPTLHTVHTLHGRSVAVAAGLQLGDHAVPKERPLKPIVLVGDGGAGIGLLHLVHAAQMNVDVTVVLHNNLLYGMTGGQHSVMTLSGMKTITTPEGSPIPALDLGAILLGAGAGFYARTYAPGGDVAEFIHQAVEHPGFACVEVYELCPTFATKRDGLTMKDLKEIPETRGKEFGILRNDKTRKAFLDGDVRLTAKTVSDERGISPNPAWRNLDTVAQVVVAGRAGERIQSAVSITAMAAMSAGLHVTLRTDNPVTQGSGFSIAELTIAPDQVAFTGLRNPDLVIVTAPEGERELSSRGIFANSTSVKKFVFDKTLEVLKGVTAESVDLRTRFGAKNAALGALMTEITKLGWWKSEAWKKALSDLPEVQRKDAEAVFAGMN